MAELDRMWSRIFDQIRHVCVVKGMAMPTQAHAVSCSGKEVLIYVPAEGPAQSVSGILNSRDAFDILVDDPAGRLPFRFTKSAMGQLHWDRPPEHMSRPAISRGRIMSLILAVPVLLSS